MDIDLLPLVNPDIGDSLQHELPDNDAKYVYDQIERISKLNPCIAQFISTYALEMETDDNPQIVLGVALCGIMVYRLLESQAEADEMNNTLLLFDPNE